MKQANVRDIALQLLLRMEKENSFSHVLIYQMIEKQQLTEQDERLLTELVYGTMERKITLNYYLTPFLQTKKKIDSWVLLLLEMSLFQIVFLDKIPPYAVINEAVEIAKKRGHKGVASLVNGVLRNVLRNGVPSLENIKDPLERLAIETSHPMWLVSRWNELYGFETTMEMCRANVTKKKMTVRVNRLKTTREKLIEKLQTLGIEAKASAYHTDSIIIEAGNILKTNVIKEGLATIQDESSMLAAHSLQLEPGMKVLDTCSAPGGKATYVGELMENNGEIFSHDLHEKKIQIIHAHAERLGLTNIVASKQDARNLASLYKKETFDRILVDAPCTGFGVIRSKPDIKYNKQPADSEQLQAIQRQILEEVAPLLKKDGKLVYSTCTVETMENEAVIETFLNNNQTFVVDEQFLQEMKGKFPDARITPFGIQLFPQTINSDGFFISRLIKEK